MLASLLICQGPHPVLHGTQGVHVVDRLGDPMLGCLPLCGMLVGDLDT
jgi:hypothetical protein